MCPFWLASMTTQLGHCFSSLRSYDPIHLPLSPSQCHQQISRTPPVSRSAFHLPPLLICLISPAVLLPSFSHDSNCHCRAAIWQTLKVNKINFPVLLNPKIFPSIIWIKQNLIFVMLSLSSVPLTWTFNSCWKVKYPLLQIILISIQSIFC